MSATPEQIDDAVVEHVAQAISFNDNGNYTPNYKWSLVPELLQDSYRRNARAAITAYLSATKDAQAEREKVLALALRRLTYWAQTSGGTAGRDDGLVAAIDIAVGALRAHDAALRGEA